eukprot:6470712-Amphidinium_carterae.1
MIEAEEEAIMTAGTTREHVSNGLHFADSDAVRHNGITRDVTSTLPRFLAVSCPAETSPHLFAPETRSRQIQSIHITTPNDQIASRRMWRHT